jgi:cytochrome P450
MQNLCLDSQLAKLFASSPPEEDYARDPHIFLDKLRCTKPRYFHEERTAWLISGYYDVVLLMRDDRLAGTTSFLDRSPLFRSTVIRKLRGLFSGAQLNAFQPMVDRIVATQLKLTLAKTNADFVIDFTKIIPIAVMAELLGIPQSDWPTLVKLSDSVLDAFDLTWPGHSRPPKVMQAFLYEYFRQHYASARRGGATPLMKVLLEEQQENDLSEESMVDACMKLVTAGSSTTAGGLANIMSRLLMHNDFQAAEKNVEWRSLADELLRLDTPVLAVKRIALERFQFQDITIDAGERVYLLIASANRDPNTFLAPNQVNCHRESKSHLSFGPGHYHCIGAALAKLEVVSMLKHIIPVLDRIRIDKPISWRSGWLVHEAQKIEVIING